MVGGQWSVVGGQWLNNPDLVGGRWMVVGLVGGRFFHSHWSVGDWWF